MEHLLPQISEWFLRKEKWLRVFAQKDSRVEGWFKGEMLVCLQQLQDEGHIEQFEREFTIGAKDWGKSGQLRIDFRIRKAGLDNLCEVKAVCISEALTARDLDFYFRPKGNRGITKDFLKLGNLQRSEAVWILSFFYPAPSGEEWSLMMRKWADVISPWVCVTAPSSYPEWFFLGCWKLHKNAERTL